VILSVADLGSLGAVKSASALEEIVQENEFLQLLLELDID